MTAHYVNIFLLSFGALQGALLSLWFLRNRKHSVSNVWFACFLIAIGLQLTFKVITKLWLMQHVSAAYFISYKLPYLVGPLLFLYVATRKRSNFEWYDLTHFFPFLVSVATLFLSLADVVAVNVHPYAQACLQLVSLFTYGFLSLSRAERSLHSFIKIVVLVESIVIITLAVMYMFYGRFPDVRLLFIVLTALIYWISYRMLSKPEVFEGNDAPVIALKNSKSPKYAHSSLKPAEATRIEQELRSAMEHEKLYLDSALTIDKLSARLKTSRHHLSQVLNEKLSRNYTEYITDLRLEECRRRLSSPANFRFTIAGIALDCGFSTVSSFNDVFKKRYGITPSRFRDEQLNTKMSA